MKKYFDTNGDMCFCYELKHFKNYGKELILEEAEPSYGDGTFYCSALGEVGLVADNGCGKECSEYDPRNGKNGRCRHSSPTYVGSGKFFIFDEKNKPRLFIPY